MKEFKDENKCDDVKKTKKEENKPSKFNIFLLIICLLLIIYLGINFYLKKDFDVNEIIKTGSFLLSLLIIVILMFKTNTKKTIPYVLLITIVLIIYTIFGITYSEPNLYVSDFINKDISEVISFTNKYNLNLEILHEYSDTVLKNHIIMQDYGINTLISDIKDFKITVSVGPNYDKEIVNHQNNEGNTLLHILATRNYMKVAPIIKKLKRNEKLSYNLKNNQGKTILDLAIEKDNLSTAFKILEDKRFNNIDVMSFLSFYKTFIKSGEYGKYTKLSNLEVIVSNLEKKNELLPMMDKLVTMIKENFDRIKNELMKNKLTSMDHIIKEVLVEVEA